MEVKQLKCGWLKKQGGNFRTWRERWFILTETQIYYYQSHNDLRLVGTIPLDGVVVAPVPFNPSEPEKFLFNISPDAQSAATRRIAGNHETFLLWAETEEDRRAWINAIECVLYTPVGGGMFGRELSKTVAVDGENIPIIVHKCAEFIRQCGLETQGIFRLAGSRKLVAQLRDDMNRGLIPTLTFPQHDVHSVASLLKQYFRELPEPLIPYEMTEMFSISINVLFNTSRDMQHRIHSASSIIKLLRHELPKANYDVLYFLCQLLHDVHLHSDKNKMHANNLSLLFNPSIIRSNENMLICDSSMRFQSFCTRLILHCNRLFIDRNSSNKKNTILDLPECELDEMCLLIEPKNLDAETQSPRDSFLQMFRSNSCRPKSVKLTKPVTGDLIGLDSPVLPPSPKEPNENPDRYAHIFDTFDYTSGVMASSVSSEIATTSQPETQNGKVADQFIKQPDVTVDPVFADDFNGASSWTIVSPRVSADRDNNEHNSDGSGLSVPSSADSVLEHMGDVKVSVTKSKSNANDIYQWKDDHEASAVAPSVAKETRISKPSPPSRRISSWRFIDPELKEMIQQIRDVDVDSIMENVDDPLQLSEILAAELRQVQNTSLACISKLQSSIDELGGIT